MQLTRTRQWREARGLTQRELAAEAGVGEVTVARIETGASVTPPTARKIAEALGVSVADLLESPPVPLVKAPAESTSPDEAAGAENEEAQRMRNLARPMLELMDYTVERWEARVREGRVDQTAYQISWEDLRGIHAALNELGRVLEEEGIDWSNPRNRRVGRVHHEIQSTYIDLANAHQGLIEAYYTTLTRDELNERRRLDEEKRSEVRPPLVTASDVAG